MNMRSPEGVRAWIPDRSKSRATQSAEQQSQRPESARAWIPDRSKLAEREASVREAETSAEDQWEARRVELVARGDIFDAQGHVTKQGQDILIKSGWKMGQVNYLENLHRDIVAPLTVISGEEERDEGPAMSAQERPQVLADARARSDQALQDRARRDEETRTAEIGRKRAGTQAYMQAVRNNMSDADAERAQRDAEQVYDAQRQRERNMREAS